MKNQYYIFLHSIIFFFISFSIDGQHSIIGDDVACAAECKTYNLSGGVGGPYYWKSTGDIRGTNQGTAVEICWNTIGSNSITLVDFSASLADQLQTFNVDVFAFPSPEIIPPKYPTCVIRDTLNGSTGENEGPVIECITACSGSVAFYSNKENNDVSAIWEVEGGTIISNDTDGILVQWNPSGKGLIKLIESNNIGCIDSTYYCVEILDPLDIDILAFNGGPTSINVCRDQDVYLQAVGSQEATSFEWYFGDGSISTGANTTVNYDQGGTYDVMLIGSSECKCFDTTYYQIIVEINPGPEITCIGTTCGNEEQTYYAANTCSSYIWNVSGNGTITDGGGSSDNFITINWGNGPVGTVGLSLDGCSEAICASETVVQIPILDGSATIEGPSIVCRDGYSTYSIQYYNGTDYTWSISGNGAIIDGFGTNQITVAWDNLPFAAYNATITVDYENCYLECGGQTSLDVELKPSFKIGGSGKICKNSLIYISAVEGWNNAVVSWTITSPSGIVTNYPNMSYISEIFTEEGIYKVSAIDDMDDYCNHQEDAYFEIVGAPLPPVQIDGPMVICKNQFYTYTVDLPPPGVGVVWTIRDGTGYKQIKSNFATLQWTSDGPYELRVSYLRDDIYCISEEFTVFLEAAQNATISGSAKTCIDEIDTYSIGATNGTVPEWSIDPGNAGSIIHNPDNTIDVMWHIPGSHQITSDYCGASILYDVEVSPLGINSIDFLKEICPGELTPITSTIPGSSSVVIRDDQDNIVGTTTSVDVSNGTYEVEITSIDGCIEIVPVVIDTFLPPKVRVSSPNENAFCLPHPNVTITALDTKDGYTYEWFKDNVSLGLTTSSISTNQYGGYHVQVTDKNGCTAISNTHRLYEWCMGDPPPGTCTGGGGGTINPDEISLRCNNLQFTVSGASMMSTSFIWQFDDPDSGADNVSTETSPIHEFTSAGYFYVFVQGNVAGEDGVDIFTIPAAPRFDYASACAGNEVQFRNHSTFIPGYDITNYTWNFDDPSSGADNTSNDENPTHIFDIPGTYNVTLDIESSSGCLSTFMAEVIVEGGPIAEFISPPSACSNDGIFFESFPDPNIKKYEWNFDDPSSGASNTSNNPNAIHTFSSNGTYNVSLSVSGENNCVETITKAIVVSTTTLSGDITANKPIPICFGDDITLTAPAGGDTYLWSNGDIGQTITVTEPGLYFVTVADNTGCHYVPDPLNVLLEGNIFTKIRIIKMLEFYNESLHFDSLEICEGEQFSLYTTWISGASYEWSNAYTSNFIPYNELSGLPVGRHDFNVTITDPLSGCDIESDPITIIIHALPDPIQISSSNANPCEGEEHILTVDNPDPDLLYYWNNGVVGLSTTVVNSGSYNVIAINKNGCERESPNIFIAPIPNANKINTGCLEACFPDTICSPDINGAFGYQWLLNGLPLAGPNGSSNTLIAEEAGDYQLVVANFHGCLDTSDVLSIDAEPSDQSVFGIVFIDDNNNGIWDVGEELLPGVPVNLYMGNLLVSTITTDVNGYYNFDPVTTSNPRIEIDTTGLGLNLTGGILEGDVDFLDCIEDKEKDFPLIKACNPVNTNVELFTCTGETIIVNNIVLQEGDTWTFDDLSALGCDSITLVNVLPYPESEVMLTTLESCQDISSGILDITIMTGSGLEFAIDNNNTYSSNLQFTGLDPGVHTLWLTDENNCLKSYTFEIEVAQTPQMNTIAQNSCINGNTGTAEIIPTIPGNYQYSLDGINFSSNNNFTDLAEGAYTIYVQDALMCTYEYPFVISSNPEPQFDLVTSKSCFNGSNGTLDILAISPGSYTYSFNNITFSNQTYYENLPVGSWLLYVQEIDGCTHTYPFDIQPKVEPQIDIITVNTCIGQNQGSLIITPSTAGNYEYSIDGITYSGNLEFTNLGEGPITVYLLEDGICEFQYLAAIVAQPEPAIIIETENACPGESNGIASVNTSETGLMYSIDQITYSSQILFDDLSAGVHTIYVLADNGCVHEYEFEIFESEALEVGFEDPILDCSIQSVKLAPIIYSSRGELNYNWSTGSNDSTLLVENSGQYSLEVSDKCSMASYTWDIQIEDITADQPIYIPNIFSPNQDGINECFIPVLNEKTILLNFRLIIFDRWGNKHFETTDLEDCWDGTYNGKEVRSGVFVYMIDMDYTYCEKVENLKKYGDVTIVY